MKNKDNKQQNSDKRFLQYFAYRTASGRTDHSESDRESSSGQSNPV